MVHFCFMCRPLLFLNDMHSVDSSLSQAETLLNRKLISLAVIKAVVHVPGNVVGARTDAPAAIMCSLMICLLDQCGEQRATRGRRPASEEEPPTYRHYSSERHLSNDMIFGPSGPYVIWIFNVSI
ncbi:hypothetical protein TTRE_0000607201 [Trichuris trichiura]|uniref:Uncharacterized protein n=1 Tax=Trichuris trichiura TaxID=36087 RepID=A0A077ZBL3_TRITR|nr:hypothetical protein TTRE_0000607201 [Trichuris trichiura]